MKTAYSYEVEIKCLIGGQEEAEFLTQRMGQLDPNLRHLGFHKQLNHYFTSVSEGLGPDSNLAELARRVSEHINQAKKEELLALAARAQTYSLRTREASGVVSLVLKVSVDEGTSANTVSRIELQVETPNLTLAELDNLVLQSGFGYQAKWSRERNEYEFLGIAAAIDKNAGYGHLAEFEITVNDPELVEEAKVRIRKIITDLGLEELEQARLERMFDFYNNNWQDYYGTDKVFVVK